MKHARTTTMKRVTSSPAGRNTFAESIAAGVLARLAGTRPGRESRNVADIASLVARRVSDALEEMTRRVNAAVDREVALQGGSLGQRIEAVREASLGDGLVHDLVPDPIANTIAVSKTFSASDLFDATPEEEHDP